MSLARTLLFLVLALPVCALSQGVDIRGVVSDSSTGERIPYASVVVVGTGRGAATNLDGFYLIPNVPSGEYDVSVSAVGYTRQVRSVAVGVEKVALDVRMPPEAVEVEEVVVTEMVGRELREISTSVHVMDTKALQMVPVTIQSDVLRSIQILPGVVSSSDVSSHFYVRGGASDQNLFLLDGVRVYSPFHAFGIFSIFDSDIINATEVYTGAFPPEFGGRLSSVVNLKTKDGRHESHAASASINQLSAKLMAEGPISEKTRFIVNARKSLFSDAYKTFFDQDVPISFYDVFAKMSFDGGASQTRFSLFTFQSQDKLPSGNAVDPNYAWSNALYGARATTLFSDRVYVSTLLAFTSATEERDPLRGSDIPRAATSVKEFSIRGDGTIYTDDGSLYFVGFDFSFPTLEYRFTNLRGIPKDLTDTSPEISAWVRYRKKWGEVQLDGGLHLDGASVSGNRPLMSTIQPRIHLSVPLLPAWRAKFSFGNHTQNVITLSNEDDLISLFEAWSVVPAGIPKEESQHYVAAIQGNLTGELSIEVQSYYKHYSSLVAFNHLKIDETDPDYIRGKGEAYGVESMVRFGMRPVDVYVAYSLGWVRTNQGDFTYAPRYDRRHTLKFLGVVTPLPNLDVTVRWEFGSGFPYSPTAGFYDRLLLGSVFDQGFVTETGKAYILLGPKNSVRLPAYHRMDVSLTYSLKLGPVELGAGAHLLNVYDRRNIFYFDRQSGRRIDMLPFYPSFTFTLSYK